jgi:hypothetical protein
MNSPCLSAIVSGTWDEGGKGRAMQIARSRPCGGLHCLRLELRPVRTICAQDPRWRRKFGRPFSTSNPLRGCNSDFAQYSHTPILHHSAWPDSRTRTTTRTRTKPAFTTRERYTVRFYATLNRRSQNHRVSWPHHHRRQDDTRSEAVARPR